MSASDHPIAQRLSDCGDSPARLLATVMLLPLVDGIFPAFVLAGGIDTLVGVVQTGLLIFGGSASAAVVLTEFTASPRENAKDVLAVGLLLVPLAAIEAALAPTISSVLAMPTFERFAAVVMIALAAKTASAEFGTYLPRPSAIIALGFVASLRPDSLAVSLSIDPVIVIHAVASALVGLGFALTLAVCRDTFVSRVDTERFRFGSSVALGMIGLSILGLVPMAAPLAVLAVVFLLTYNPESRE